ncbi:hypothetical protein P8918_13625 [Bacillus spizizenii]|nr:hypothetical protein [Bacillus spizizenii]MCY8890344.1 hypothetical protein [Bacillus spizizenii]MEC0842068.1 hypothetical protein [Bacillus spizizenii]
MAIRPQQLGKMFKDLNTGKTKWGDLAPEVKEQMTSLRGNTKPGTQAHKYWNNQDFKDSLRNDSRIKEAVNNLNNSVDTSKFRSPVERRKDLHASINARGEMERYSPATLEREQRTEAFRQKQAETARQREIKSQQMDIDSKIGEIYSTTQDKLVNQGFSEREAKRAVDTLKNDKLNVMDLSDDRLTEMATDRLYDIRANRRLEREVGPRRQEKLGEKGIERKKQEIIEEERKLDQQRQGGPAASGGSPSGQSSTTTGNDGEAWKPSNKIEQHMFKKHSGMVDDLASAVSSGQNMDANAVDTYMRQFRFEGETGEKFANLLKSGKGDAAVDLAKRNAKNYAGSANMMDKAVAHKLPQKGAVVVGGAWLVNNMSSSRGQQSNAQLYGQQQPYM